MHHIYRKVQMNRYDDPKKRYIDFETFIIHFHSHRFNYPNARREK